MDNPLIDDRLVDLILDELVELDHHLTLPYFGEHSRETISLYLASCRRIARERLYPGYRAADETPPRLVDGRVEVHEALKTGFAALAELGTIGATRTFESGGQQLPAAVSALAHAYLMAGNLGVSALAGLTSGAAHLIDAFADDEVRARFLEPMMSGRWTGTMALTEPHAGSSLGDLTTRARPHEDGTYRIRGSKIFISGGDHDATENIVHLTLARIEGAPSGNRGISLFAVPRLRADGGRLVDNDVAVSGVIHKIGWRCLPSLALSFGDRDDCHGWLVGIPHRGLAHMFQMMNEARIMVGVNAAATASVAYHESVGYARERTQGRALGSREVESPQVPLVSHPDVRRMLLRQKAIVDGSFALAAEAGRLADVSEHANDPDERVRAQRLLDLLTPIVKSFPAEFGYEANVLSLQIHGGYGYSSEYLPEAWLRDQKLNSIHEGTTGIQALDLLGRKVMAGGGAAAMALGEEIQRDAARAEGLPAELVETVTRGLARVQGLTLALGQRGMTGDLEGMLGHSTDYLTMLSILVVAWQHLRLARAGHRRGDAFGRGLVRSASYWIATEVPRIAVLADLCESAERSYLDLDPDEL